MWVAELSSQQPPLQYATIQGYVAHIRSLHVELGFDNNFGSFGVLRDTLKGVRRVLGGGTSRIRRPLTADILRRFPPFLRLGEVDDAMVWAAVTTCWAGLFRAGELARTSSSAQFPLASDVSWGIADGVRFFQLRVGRSKTDPFGSGVCVTVGEAGGPICAYSAMRHFLISRRSSGPVGASAPLFAFRSGEVLSSDVFIRVIRTLLRRAGLPEHEFAGHSLRIGGATDLARARAPDHIIKVAGRWRSDAYQTYVRPSLGARAALAGLMCSRTGPHAASV